MPYFWRLQKQIFLARLDQELHSGPMSPGASEELAAQLAAETLSFAAVPGCAPQVHSDCLLSIAVSLLLLLLLECTSYTEPARNICYTP